MMTLTSRRIADRLSRENLTLATCRAAVKVAIGDGCLPRGIDAAAREILALATAQREKRRSRAACKRLPPTKPLAERLVAHKAAQDAALIELVRRTRKGLYRVATNAGKYSTASGHTTVIKIGTPGVKGESWKVSGKNYPSTASRHEYTVARDWIATVYDRDLEVVDGMFTLAVTPVLGHGPELYRALWVEQGRGSSLNQMRGYIARIDTTTYHATTARAALDGVQRKAGLKPARRKGTLDLDRLVRRHGDLPVTFADGRECGLCASGIRSWCHAVGIDPDGGMCALADVVRGYRLRPLPEVLSVVRRVVRDRNNRQPVDLTTPPSALESDGRVVFDAEGGFRIVPSDN